MKTINVANKRMEKRGDLKTEKGAGIGDFIFTNGTPRDVFNRVGDGVNDGFMALRRGFDKHIDI